MPCLKDFEEILERDVPLATLTSFRIGGAAKYLFEPRNEAELASVVAFLAESDTPWRLIGGGTNILASDEGFDGALVRLAGDFRRIEFDGLAAIAGAAAPLAALVSQSAERGLSGAECLAGIPGTVGGALVMNAGGRWGQMSGLVESVTVFEGGASNTLSAGQLRFNYRWSSLEGRVVVSARLVFERADQQEIRQRVQQFFAEKRSSQPLSQPSAGCVFKNPPGDSSAGALIDKAGLKGLSVGDAVVSPIHANYIVNTGRAASRDVRALIEQVRSRVKEAFGIELDLEIELW